MVSKGRVACQHRAMRIGADHRARDGSLRAVATVPDPEFDACQRPALWPETGISPVILEPGQPLLVTVALLPTAEDLTDRTDRPARGGHVEQAKTLDHLVVGTNSERLPDDLVAGAHSEDSCPAVNRPVQPAGGLQRPYGCHLRRVLAATKKVDPPAVGKWIARL